MTNYQLHKNKKTKHKKTQKITQNPENWNNRQRLRQLGFGPLPPINYNLDNEALATSLRREASLFETE